MFKVVTKAPWEIRCSAWQSRLCWWEMSGCHAH